MQRSQVIRFLLVGVLNTFVGYVIFIVVYFLWNNVVIALLCTYVLGILFNYKTYSKYVFTSSRQKIFINFVIIYISIFIFNNYLINFIKDTIQVNLYISQLLAISVVTPLLYVLTKKYVFIEKFKI